METANRPPLVIRPGTGWEVLNLPELWHFRDLRRTPAGRDMTLRYRQTGPGSLWDRVQSLVPTAILSTIVGALTRPPGIGIPFVLFAFAGVPGWTTFANALTRASGSVVHGSRLLVKVYFRRLVLPLSTVGLTVAACSLGLVVLSMVMPFFHREPSPAIVLLPIWFLLLVMLARGTGYTLLMLIIGLIMFNRSERRFADVV